MSRHRESVNFYINREDFPSHKDMVNTVSRVQSKDVAMDYAHIRGLNVQEDHCITPDNSLTHPTHTRKNTPQRNQTQHIRSNCDKPFATFL